MESPAADEAYAEADYIDGIWDLTALFTPLVFETWSGLASYDICQEPPASVDPGYEPFPMTQVELSREDFDDLCRVHLFDWLEQVPRSQRGWGYRGAAYRAIAERLGGAALATYDRVFAQEPAPSAHAAD